MTEKSMIIKILKNNKEVLRKYSVSSLGIFGSVARNKPGKKRDLDIIVEFKKPTFNNYFGLKEYLEKKTGRKTDLLCRDAIKPAVKKSILREAQWVIR